MAGNTEATRRPGPHRPRRAITAADVAASYPATATVRLTPTDTVSGVAWTKWRVDGGSWTAGTVASIAYDPSTTHTFEWYSVDLAGNAEQIQSASFAFIGRVEQTDPGFAWRGTWTLQSSALRSGGSWRYTASTGAVAYVSFTGTDIGLISTKSSSYGIARITLDGGAPESADFYAPGALHQQTVWSKHGLAPGRHFLKIECSGTKNAPRAG